MANKAALPACLRRYADRIESVSDERASDNGCWAFMKPGWTCDPLDAHDAHEDTWAEVARVVGGAVPCHCKSCSSE